MGLTAIPSARSRNTVLNSGVCVRFSLGSGFLSINKEVCKQICPVWLQGREDWTHAPSKPVCGGGVGLHPFSFVVCLFDPPPRLPFFLLFWSSPIAFSPKDTHVPYLIHWVSRSLLSESPLGIDYYFEFKPTYFRRIEQLQLFIFKGPEAL